MRKTNIEWSKPTANIKNIALVLAASVILYAIMAGIDAAMSMIFV